MANFEDLVGKVEDVQVIIPSLMTAKPTRLPQSDIPQPDLSLLKMMEMGKKQQEEFNQLSENIPSDLRVNFPAQPSAQLKENVAVTMPSVTGSDDQITQAFGNKNPELYGPNGWNRGVDIAAKPGEVQSAPKEGRWVVKEAYTGDDFNTGWGRSVVIVNPDTGETIRRSHLDQVYVQPGQEVTGKPLGTTGRTGRTTGYHKDVEYTNPKGQLSDYTQTPYYKDQPMPMRDTEMQDYSNLVSRVPEKSRAAAQKNIPLIVSALKEEGIDDPNTIAYALATIEHETAGTFQPIEEYGGRQQARSLGYEGGEDYFGRGFIQLTHQENYDAMGKRIGIPDLAQHPEKALDPEISARILAAFFKDRGVSKYTQKGDFINARRPINGLDRANLIAQLAQKYLG